jgi:hypothetical protein
MRFGQHFTNFSGNTLKPQGGRKMKLTGKVTVSQRDVEYVAGQSFKPVKGFDNLFSQKTSTVTEFVICNKESATVITIQ